MWALLVVEQVLDFDREGAGLRKIEAVVLSVPQELDALNRELLRNMGSDSLKLVQWICFATRPLSLDELRWALLVDADCPQTTEDYPSDDDGMKRRVQTLSCGLAEVTSPVRQGQSAAFSRHGTLCRSPGPPSPSSPGAQACTTERAQPLWPLSVT